MESEVWHSNHNTTPSHSTRKEIHWKKMYQCFAIIITIIITLYKTNLTLTIFEQCSVGIMTPISLSSVKFHEISRLTEKEIDLLVNNCPVPHHQIHSPLLFEEYQELCHPVCAHMVLMVTWGELQALETVEQHKQHHDELRCHYPSSLRGFLSYCPTAVFLLWCWEHFD